MTDAEQTPFADFPADLADWSAEQSAEFELWFAGNFTPGDTETVHSFANTAACDRFSELREAFYKARDAETDATTPVAGKTLKPQLDHDGDNRPGGAKKPPALQWVVSRTRGLHQAEAAEVSAALRAGGRMATERDLKVAGVIGGAEA